MKFAYYQHLSAHQKRIYDRSDALGPIILPSAAPLAVHADGIAAALARDDRGAAERAVRALTDELLLGLHVPPVRVRVLAVRPSSHVEELHGLYEFGGRRQRPLVTIWMRTASRRQVVAVRTFLRTLLHEIAHHLDYEMLGLEDSFHTRGFYRRASSLFDQVVAASSAAARTKSAAAARARRSPSPAAPRRRQRRAPSHPKPPSLPFID
jgi:hypothetical protein